MKISKITLVIILGLLFINLKGGAFANELIVDGLYGIEHADLYDSNTYQSIWTLHAGYVDIYGGTFSIRETKGGGARQYGGTVTNIQGADMCWFYLYDGTVNSMFIHYLSTFKIYGGIVNNLEYWGFWNILSYIYGGYIENLDIETLAEVNIYGGYIENFSIEDRSKVDIYGGHFENIFVDNTSQLHIYGGIIDNLVYEPVPEPATMLLLGSGLIGLVGLWRKFRK